MKEKPRYSLKTEIVVKVANTNRTNKTNILGRPDGLKIIKKLDSKSFRNWRINDMVDKLIRRSVSEDSQ